MSDYHSRREFVAISAVGGVAATTLSAGGKTEIREEDVEIKMPGGVSDAAFFAPADGASHAGVLVWPDAGGLRPSFRDIGRRVAAEGYAVLVPNPFYRLGKAPFFTDASHLDFKDAAVMSKLGALMTSVGAPGHAEEDAVAYIKYLDSRKEVDRAKKIGTQGYCMGGALVVRTAATIPDRVGAGASFHGGGLVTAKPDSPHLLAPKIKARMYFGIAASDDAKQPDAKDKLRASFTAAHVPVDVEVYENTKHGWCISDMPQESGSPVYNQPAAERAWTKLSALYKTTLA